MRKTRDLVNYAYAHNMTMETEIGYMSQGCSDASGGSLL